VTAGAEFAVAREARLRAPNPRSVLHADGGRQVEVKVHRRLLHGLGMLGDAWTLNADGGDRWLGRLAGLVDAGVDMISSDTPRELVSGWAQGGR
jgi:hypothetical protein